MDQENFISGLHPISNYEMDNLNMCSLDSTQNYFVVDLDSNRPLNYSDGNLESEVLFESFQTGDYLYQNKLIVSPNDFDVEKHLGSPVHDACSSLNPTSSHVYLDQLDHSKQLTDQLTFIIDNYPDNSNNNQCTTHPISDIGEWCSKPNKSSHLIDLSGEVHILDKTTNNTSTHLCFECPMTFCNITDFNIHYILNHTAKPFGQSTYSCFVCSKSFQRYPVYRSHLYEHYVDREDNISTSTKMDGPPVQESTNQVSSLLPSITNYRCRLCGMLLSSVGKMKLHYRLRHSSHYNRFKPLIDQCKAHDKRDNQPTEIRKSKSLATHNLKLWLYANSRKPKNFNSLVDNFIRNLSVENPTNSNNCPNESRLGRTKKRKLNWHKCDVCHKKFSKACLLKRHMIKHTKEKMFQCTLCQLRFGQKSSAKTHIFLTHWKDFEFAHPTADLSNKVNLNGAFDHNQLFAENNYSGCDACHPISTEYNHFDDAQFIQWPSNNNDDGLIENDIVPLNSNLTTIPQTTTSTNMDSVYVKTKYSNVESIFKLFSCKICNLKFETLHKLRCHMTKHSHERLFSCYICHKRFKFLQNCRKHLKSHHHHHTDAMHQAEDTKQTSKNVSDIQNTYPSAAILDYTNKNESGRYYNQSDECVNESIEPEVVYLDHVPYDKSHAQMLNVYKSDTGLGNLTTSIVHYPNQTKSNVQPIPDCSNNFPLEDEFGQEQEERLLDESNIILSNYDDVVCANFEDNNVIGREEIYSTHDRDQTQLNTHYPSIIQESSDMEFSKYFDLTNQMPPDSSSVIDETSAYTDDELVAIAGSDFKYFGCKLCSLSYSHSDELLIHYHTEHACDVNNRKPHLCTHCSNQFENTILLQIHLRTCSNSNVAVKTKHCQSYQSVGSCPLCPHMKFGTKSGLTRHVLANHPDPGSKFAQPFCCTRCDQAFSMLRSLQVHVKHIYEGSFVCRSKDEPVQVESMNKVDKRAKNYYPIAVLHSDLIEEIAKLRPSSRLSLSEQYLIQAAVERVQNTISLPKSQTTEGYLSLPHSNLPHLHSTYSQHQNRFICTGMRRYQCVKCHRKFSKFMDLTRHTLKIHQSLRPFDLGQNGDSRRPSLHCHLCNRPFGSKTSLAQHMRLHTDTKCYLCPHCSSVFHNPSLRKRHMLTQCTALNQSINLECSHSYVQQLNQNTSSLTKSPCACPNLDEYCDPSTIHLDIIQCVNDDNDDDDVDNQCNLKVSKLGLDRARNVDKSKVRMSSMPQEDQIRIKSVKSARINNCEFNRLFKCSTCMKVFTKHASLLRHERIHSLTRPYQCSHCDRKFSQSFSLTIHEMTHTGEKPHSCPHCALTFRQRCNMKRHVKRVHYLDIA